MSLDDPQESFTGIQATIPFQAGTPTSRVVAPYAIDQMKFSGKFQLLLGLRYDNIDYADDLQGIDRDDSELSPMAGFVYTPSSDLTLYANAGRSHAPPSPRLIGDLASFVPEESTQYEIGAKKLFLGGKVHTTFALYQIDRENIGISDSTGFTQQAGDQRSRGFEIDFAAEPLPRLRTILSLAYNDSELTRFVIEEQGPPAVGVDLSGNDPAFAPKELLSLWVSKSFASSNWSVAGGLRYVGDQYISEFNQFAIDAY
ncbi:MAG: TonB-dependent receptor, partial [Planctomycetota bacterium]